MKNRLIKLLAENRANPARRFDVVAAAEGNADEAEVFLYDAIVDDELDAEYFGGIAPRSFITALRGITASTIHLRINSPGGSVFAARAIETAIREHPAKCVVHIDGLAASAATFIAMAGDEVVMSPGAMFMVHKAWTVAYGNCDDLVATADLLDKIDGTLAETYAKKTGMEPSKCMELMAAETWLTAKECLECGFVDSISDPDSDGDSQKMDPDGPDDRITWNLSAYAKAPAQYQRAASFANQSANRANVAALLRKLDAESLIP